MPETLPVAAFILLAGNGFEAQIENSCALLPLFVSSLELPQMLSLLHCQEH